MELTGGLGADVAIEAVGVPETFELCTELIRPGGRVANVGVHGKCATLHLEKLWIRDVLITTGLVDTNTTPTLLKLIEGGRLDPTVFATHRFALDDTEAAYDVFARSGRDARAQGRAAGRPGRARSARGRAGRRSRLRAYRPHVQSADGLAASRRPTGLCGRVGARPIGRSAERSSPERESARSRMPVTSVGRMIVVWRTQPTQQKRTSHASSSPAEESPHSRAVLALRAVALVIASTSRCVTTASRTSCTGTQSVAVPFMAGEVRRFPLDRLVASAGGVLRHGRVLAVDPGRHVISTDTGEVPYDVLVLALGAQSRAGGQRSA